MTKRKIFAASLAVLALLIANGAFLYAQNRGRSIVALVAPAPVTSVAPTPLVPAATPTVGTPTATPAIMTVNTPTTVTVTAQISDPTFISGGANLLRLGASGTQSTILGVMHDDGLNGDSVANDKIYSLNVPLNETTAGQIQLQVSAAFKGALKRVTSTLLALNVWNKATDSSLDYAVTYPPSYSIVTSKSGSVIADTGAFAIVGFGSTFSPDGIPTTGLLLYVYQLSSTYVQSDEPGPPFLPADCQSITVSGFAGQLCVQTLQIDMIDKTIYRKQLSVTTGKFRYELRVSTNSTSDPNLGVFDEMVNRLQLF